MHEYPPLPLPPGRHEFSRGEVIADGVIHSVGIATALIGGGLLLGFSVFHAGPWEYAAAVLYIVSLVAALSISCAYNLWPISATKWVLRRFDHAAIYLLIAGTYTPFIAQLDGSRAAVALIIVIWGAAALGMAMKLFLPGRFDRLAIAFYLAIGWSGVLLGADLVELLPLTTLVLIVAGGVVYSAGVVFHLWRSLKFQNATWHAFVVVAAALHLVAVSDSLIFSRL